MTTATPTPARPLSSELRRLVRRHRGLTQRPDVGPAVAELMGALHRAASEVDRLERELADARAALGAQLLELAPEQPGGAA